MILYPLQLGDVIWRRGERAVVVGPSAGLSRMVIIKWDSGKAWAVDKYWPKNDNKENA